MWENFKIGFLIILGLKSGELVVWILLWMLRRVQLAVHDKKIDRFNRKWL
jgi:hypothetical protein